MAYFLPVFLSTKFSNEATFCQTENPFFCNLQDKSYSFIANTLSTWKDKHSFTQLHIPTSWNIIQYLSLFFAKFLPNFIIRAYVLRFWCSSGLMSYTRVKSLWITSSLFFFTLSLIWSSLTFVCSSILAWKSSLDPMCYWKNCIKCVEFHK